MHTFSTCADLPLLLCRHPAADISASLELQKGGDLPAGQLANDGHVIMHMANPSAPPTATAAAEPQVLLSLPWLSVDLDITKQKVPLLRVADAPCKKLCKNKCQSTMEKTCLNVTLPKKVRQPKSSESAQRTDTQH
jgi:hypothetical protein